MFYKKDKTYPLGLALGGGAARGFAHIGVLQAFSEAGVRIDCVSGSSIGALMALFCAAGKSPVEMLDIARHVKSYRLRMTLGSFRFGITGLDYVEQLVRKHIGAVRFEDLEKPLFVCVTNMHSGQYEIISQGEIIPAVRASCAIPVRYDEQKIDGLLYVDGGMRNNLPVEPLKECCHTVVGVSVNPLVYRNEQFKLKQIIMRMLELVIAENEAKRVAMCDYHIEVKGLENFEFEEYGKVEEIYQLGYQVAC